MTQVGIGLAVWFGASIPIAFAVGAALRLVRTRAEIAEADRAQAFSGPPQLQLHSRA